VKDIDFKYPDSQQLTQMGDIDLRVEDSESLTKTSGTAQILLDAALNSELDEAMEVQQL
jgi:hypothetical protein